VVVMGFNFERFKSPEFQAKLKAQEEERARKEQERNKSLCVVGVDPDHISVEDYDQLITTLEEIISDEIKNEGISWIFTTCEPGVGQLAALTVHKMKDRFPELKNFIVRPFSENYLRWESHEQDMFSQIKELVDGEIIVDEIEEYHGTKGLGDLLLNTPLSEFAAKMQQRDRFLADHNIHVVSVAPVTGLKYHPDHHILKSGRYSGMRYTRVYSDHNFSYDRRFNV
jgi:uncharacterized phage-like protein YoqJ